MLRKSLLAAVILLTASVALAADTYTIDQVHSNIGFSVRHMTVSKVKGGFRDFEGTVTIDPADTSKWVCEATIQVASIDTDNENRDNHLRSADFFDAEKFPTITFKSTKVVPKKDGMLEVHGDLTMHGVTKAVVLDAELIGSMEDGSGNRLIGFSAETEINRMDYGVSYNNVLETGGLVVGHDVTISIDIEAIMTK